MYSSFDLVSGGGKFLPSKVANLRFWLESDYGITKDASDAVSEWVDRSPNRYTLTQSTGANQPIFTANEFGSKAGLVFDGTNDSLERSVSNPFGSVQNYTCFIVNKSLNNNNGQNYMCMGDLGGTDSLGIYKDTNVGSRGNALSFFTVAGGQVDEINGNTALNDNLPHLITAESNGSAWSARIDRVNQTMTVITGGNNGEAPGDFTTLDNITIGVLRRNNVFYNRSNFAAILVYQSQLSVADRTRVENYLITKYGIAA